MKGSGAMWVDVKWYKNKYLLGRQPTLPLLEFAYWENQARSEININNVDIKMRNAPDYLKKCVCEVAEYLYHRKVNNLDNVTGFSNDGYSVSQNSKDKTREIIVRHLSGTELHNSFIFSGVE